MYNPNALFYLTKLLRGSTGIINRQVKQRIIQEGLSLPGTKGYKTKRTESSIILTQELLDKAV